MDPSRNDFNGSGLPHHGRQGHGQDQGQQQQLSGFPFQVSGNNTYGAAPDGQLICSFD